MPLWTQTALVLTAVKSDLSTSNMEWQFDLCGKLGVLIFRAYHLDCFRLLLNLPTSSLPQNVSNRQ